MLSRQEHRRRACDVAGRLARAATRRAASSSGDASSSSSSSAANSAATRVAVAAAARDDGLSLRDFLPKSSSSSDAIACGAAGSASGQSAIRVRPRAAGMNASTSSSDAPASSSSRPDDDQRRRTAFIETYGCQMNVSDSEIVASVLQSNRYVVVDDVDAADAVLVNTCAIRDGAEAKIWHRLRQLKREWKDAKSRAIRSALRRGEKPPAGGAFYVTLVPVRPRRRGERRSLRTFPVVSLRTSPLAFNPRPYDAFQRQLTPFNSTPISSLV